MIIDVNHRLLAEQIVEVMAERGFAVLAPVPDTLLDADQVRALLGKNGRMLSYPTLKKMEQAGRLTPLPGDDGRRVYFSKNQVDKLLGK